MTPIHKYTLSFLLIFLGLSLIIPGLMNAFRPSLGGDVIFAESVSGKNHLRAVNAMIAAIGFIAFLASFNVETSRTLIIALGIILLFIVAARIYSLFLEGIPSTATIVYLLVESLMAVIFLTWPPK